MNCSVVKHSERDGQRTISVLTYFVCRALKASINPQESGDADSVQSAQLRAMLCLARAAGPASVLSAVRRRLAGTARADVFYNKVSTTNCGHRRFNRIAKLLKFQYYSNWNYLLRLKVLSFQLRERLSRPLENIKPSFMAR